MKVTKEQLAALSRKLAARRVAAIKAAKAAADKRPAPWLAA
jgi:hypothetical protein